MPPADSEHGLRVQLATALRERDEWNREAGLLRDALITWQRNAEKTAAERDALRAENGRLREALIPLINFALVALRYDVDIPGFDPETHVDVVRARAALASGGDRG